MNIRSPLVIQKLQAWRDKARVIEVADPPMPEVEPRSTVVRLIRKNDPMLECIRASLLWRVCFDVWQEVTINGRLVRRAQFGLVAAIIDPWIDQLVCDLTSAETRLLRGEDSTSKPVPDPLPTPLEPWVPQIITLASEKYLEWRLCDPAEVSAALARESDKSTRRFRLEQLQRSPIRLIPLATQRHVDAVRKLEDRYPNFGGLITEICSALSLRVRLEEPLALPKMLLHGAPGTGKSRFAQALADALGFHYSEFTFAQLSAGWLLTGSSGQWRSADVGRIAAAVLNSPPDKIPLIFGDELDKVPVNATYPADVALLNALEPHTAATFNDEMLNIKIDIRPVAVMMAANRIDLIKPEVLSRLKKVSVPVPTREQMPAIVRSVDQQLREDRPSIEKVFAPLGDAVIEAVSTAAPRDIVKALEEAYCRASLDAPPEVNDIGLLPEDFAHAEKKVPAPVLLAEPLTPVPKIADEVFDSVMLTLWRPWQSRGH